MVVATVMDGVISRHLALPAQYVGASIKPAPIFPSHSGEGRNPGVIPP